MHRFRVRHRSGNIGRHLDEGWNIGGGVGTNFNSYLGARLTTIRSELTESLPILRDFPVGMFTSAFPCHSASVGEVELGQGGKGLSCPATKKEREQGLLSPLLASVSFSPLQTLLRHEASIAFATTDLAR